MTAIGVKYVLERNEIDDAEWDDEEESNNQRGYMATFRISATTKFKELHKEACKFWVFLYKN